MDKAAILMEVGKVVIAVSVGTVVDNAVKVLTPEDQGPINRVWGFIGGTILSSMVSDQAVKYVFEKAATLKGAV